MENSNENSNENNENKNENNAWKISVKILNKRDNCTFT